MRYAILSDIHANLEALTAVLATVDRLGAHRIVCLGDVVGYYSDANECIALLAARDVDWVAGNHDRAAVGLVSTREFSEVAARAIAWTAPRLSASHGRFLAALPTARLVDGLFLAVHGALSPVPNDWLHMSTRRRERDSMRVLSTMRSTRLAFFGHTHRYVVHQKRFGRMSTGRDSVVSIRPATRYLVNPGSVGQPRDDDPRASFVMYDTEEGRVTHFRVEYDRAECLRKASAHGLLSHQERDLTGRVVLARQSC